LHRRLDNQKGTGYRASNGSLSNSGQAYRKAQQAPPYHPRSIGKAILNSPSPSSRFPYSSSAAAMLEIVSPNTRAIVTMVAAMMFFTLSDVMIKLTAPSLPLGEMIVIRNVIATLGVLAYALYAGGLTLPDAPPTALLSWRIIGEMGSTLAFLGALVAMDIADVTAIMQFVPLAVTSAGAVFLKEHVGWRRWLAAFAGLIGVMIILRPGGSAFQPAAVLAVAAIGFVVLRDITTRKITGQISTVMLTFMSAAATGVAGLFLWPFETWVMPSAQDVLQLTFGALSLTLAYVFITISMRTGEIAAATPFRYTNMMFALLAGFFIWGKLPDGVSLIGIAIVIVAGLYTLHRERMRAANA
jgi:drug/metabolite transporter (DMT)-like permease